MDKRTSRFAMSAILLALVLLCSYLFLLDKKKGGASGAIPVSSASPDNERHKVIPSEEVNLEENVEQPSSEGVDLFLDNPAAASCTSESATRMRTAQLNRDGIDGLTPGDILKLNFFDDFSCDARINASYSDENGAKVVTGVIGSEKQEGFVYMSTADGKTVSFVEIPSEDKSFSAGTGNGLDYSIFENDRNKMDILKNGEDLVSTINIRLPDGNPMPEYPVFQPLAPSDFYLESDASDTRIDVMFVYTRQARLWAEGSYQGPMANILAIAVARANTALANSKVKARFRIVRSQEIPYNAAAENKGSTTTDLYSITFNNSIKELRDAYGADIVTLVTASDDIGGLGWLFNGNPDLAFNVCRVKQLANSYTFAHECGHNLGCGHSAAQAGSIRGYFPYSSGWQWKGADGKGYHSVMTYGNSSYPIDVPYFSNPSISYMGRATGDAKEANNALTIMRLKDKVSTFRPSVVTPE
ncbi:MAG: zinc-dependent metalloprotease family protein [Victivallales bacterium]